MQRTHRAVHVSEIPSPVPSETLVFVPDPEARRTARSVEAGTTVLVVGGKQGTAYQVSKWERKYFSSTE